MHRWSGEQVWIGVTLQKNGLGRLCLISAFFLIWTLVRRWRRRDIPGGKYQTYADLFVLIMTLWLLKGPPGAYSATAIVALAVGLAMFFSLLWMKKHQYQLGSEHIDGDNGSRHWLWNCYADRWRINTGGFTSTLGRDETLTGRTEIWAEPLSGCDAAAHFRTAALVAFGLPRPARCIDIGEAHNGYLECHSGTWIRWPSSFLDVPAVLLPEGPKELAYDFDWASLWICFLLMALIHNVTESSIKSFTSQLTAVLLFWWSLLRRSLRTPRSSRA